MANDAIAREQASRGIHDIHDEHTFIQMRLAQMNRCLKRLMPETTAPRGVHVADEIEMS